LLHKTEQLGLFPSVSSFITAVGDAASLQRMSNLVQADFHAATPAVRLKTVVFLNPLSHLMIRKNRHM
jgi:hypothetical protein